MKNFTAEAAEETEESRVLFPTAEVADQREFSGTRQGV
jgi:hypothetical protein